MSGAALGIGAQPLPATGLSALADLINDVLAPRGTRIAFTVPSATQRSTTGTRATGGHKPAGLLGRERTRAAGPDRRPRPRPPDEEPETTPDHAEVWQLVRQAQEGDGEAFGQLYDRYVDTVFRFVYLRVNDRALAEDFTSETFVRALRRIGSISYQGRDIGAWFVTIARNIIFDHTKSARHRLEVSTGETIETREQAQSTEAAVLHTLDAERLMAAVAKLGDEQRECITLRFIHGFSVNETAAVMGKNDGAIKALQHRAIRKLADLLGGEI